MQFNPMKRTFYTALLLAGILAGTLGCTETEQSGSDGIPEASIRAAALNEKVTVSITIPEDHHAYLNRGPHENLIPVDFDWKPALESGKILKEPELESSPEGEKEKETGAAVLRGTGEFVFTGISPAADTSLRVRTQICNEITGMCFRPAWQTITIQ